MGLDFDYADGQTPLDEDEKDALLIPSITTSGDDQLLESFGTVVNDTAIKISN